MINAYAAADYQEHMEMVEDYPYWQYIGIEDGRQSEICRNYNKKIYKANDPIWNVIYPPNHFNCRSTVLMLTKDDIEGKTISRASNNEIKRAKGMTGSFAGTPTMKNQMKKIEKSVGTKAEKLKNARQKLKK